MIEQFLKQLTTVASSPYAFVAYVALVIVWAIVVVKTRRLVAISQNLSLLPEADRKSILEKDYGFHLKEGMSAKDFLKAQRTAYVLLARILRAETTRTGCCLFARAKTFTEGLGSWCNRAATLHSDALPPSL
jgi:hypothetical protein